MAKTTKKSTSAADSTSQDMATKPDTPVIASPEVTANAPAEAPNAPKKKAPTKPRVSKKAALPANEPHANGSDNESDNGSTGSSSNSNSKSNMAGFDEIMEMVKDNKEAVAALKKLKKVALKSSVVRRMLGEANDAGKKHRKPTKFNLFVQEKMRVLTEENRGMNNKEMFKACSAMWQQLKDAEAAAKVTEPVASA